VDVTFNDIERRSDTRSYVSFRNSFQRGITFRQKLITTLLCEKVFDNGGSFVLSYNQREQSNTVLCDIEKKTVVQQKTLVGDSRWCVVDSDVVRAKNSGVRHVRRCVWEAATNDIGGDLHRIDGVI
jgi:hypothetical protein